MDYLLTGGTVVNEGRCVLASVWIRDGRIAGVFEVAGGLSAADGGPDETPAQDCGVCGAEALSGDPTMDAASLSVVGGLSAADAAALAKVERVDVRGCWILPGVIDDQVHFREPGLTYKGDMRSESRAAVAGGVTSYMEMPNTKPPTLTQALLQEKYERAAEVSLANYSFYMGCSEDNLDEVLKTDPKRVCGIKIFLGSSTGNMLVRSDAYIESLLRQAPTLVAAHCEDEEIMAANTAAVKAQYGEEPPFSVHPLIRSAEACYRSSARAAEIARRAGGRLHILHLSTARELSLLDDAPLEEARITGEVCVHHLWFTDRDYVRRQGFIKWNPAVKTEADRAALREAVRQGRVIVATDHAPHALEEKQRPYFSCPSGGPLVQHSLQLMLEMVRQGVFSLTDVVEAMCHRPARLFAVEKRGFLRPGYWADLVVVRPDEAPHTEPVHYKCGWSPLADQLFTTRVRYTFVNGHKVYDRGHFAGDDGENFPRGERLMFNR